MDSTWTPTTAYDSGRTGRTATFPGTLVEILAEADYLDDDYYARNRAAFLQFLHSVVPGPFADYVNRFLAENPHATWSRVNLLLVMWLHILECKLFLCSITTMPRKSKSDSALQCKGVFFFKKEQFSWLPPSVRNYISQPGTHTELKKCRYESPDNAQLRITIMSNAPLYGCFDSTRKVRIQCIPSIFLPLNPPNSGPTLSMLG